MGNPRQYLDNTAGLTYTLKESYSSQLHPWAVRFCRGAEVSR